MTIQFYPGIGDQYWNKDIIIAKLQNVAGADKTKVWILKDLSTPQSGYVGRACWKVAKHSSWMRRELYGVDVDVSRDILQRLSLIVLANRDMTTLFLNAVNNFQSVTGHPVSIPQEIYAPVEPVVIQETAVPLPTMVNTAVPPVVVQEPVIIREPVIVEQPVVTHTTIIEPVPVYVPAPRVPVIITRPPPRFTRRPMFQKPVLTGAGFWNSHAHHAPVTAGGHAIPGTGRVNHIPPRSTVPVTRAPATNVVPGTRSQACPRAVNTVFNNTTRTCGVTSTHVRPGSRR